MATSLPTPLIWTFTQLGPPKTQLVLQGYNAPFGRPRQGPVVNVGLKVRETRTDYPGNALIPTIHSFGVMGKPFKLHGRWMDWAMSQQGGAQYMRRTWSDFVSAQIPVRAAWGDVLSYQIFIHDIDLDFESAAELVWAIDAHMLLDEASFTSAGAPLPVAQAQPFDVASDLKTLMSQTTLPFQTFTSLLDLTGIADALSSIEGLINTPFALVYDALSQLSSFETALQSDLYGIDNGCHAMQSGLAQLIFTTDELVAQVRALNNPPGNVLTTAESLFSGLVMTSLCQAKVASDQAAQNLAFLVASLRRTIQLTTRGKTSRAYVGSDGDTWEQIGLNLLGSVDGARAIKSLNGIRYGEGVVAGRRYQIPAST